MKQNKFFNLLFNIIVALFIGVAVASNYDVDPLPVALTAFIGLSVVRIVAIYFIIHSKQSNSIGDMAFMAVQKEVWEEMIAENLFKDYSWIKRAKDRTGNVLANAVVHIPQAGSKPGASKNREVFPLPVIKRNDSDVTYPIDEISSDAVHIPNADTVELSYDKHTSVTKDLFGVLFERTALDILDRWYPSVSTNIIRTTGADTPTHLTGSTGNRKKHMVDDVDAGKAILNTQTKKDTGNRAWIGSEKMYLQLKADTKAANKDTQESVGAVWSNGDLIKLHGFDIIRTDVTARFDNTATPVKKDYALALAATYAATDNDVVLLVDFNLVHFAQGAIEFFETLRDAQYQGDIYSASVRMGARLERNDQVGVVAIVQTP